MGTVSHAIEVDAPAEQAYRWWRGLTNLPAMGEHLAHWKVDGPLGKLLERDDRIVEDVPNRKIAWQNDHASGVVRFAATGGMRTRVEVELTDADDTRDRVERALQAFKQTIENSLSGSR